MIYQSKIQNKQLLVAQLGPAYPDWQLHEYEQVWESATQFPLFKQGLDWHGVIS